MMRLNDDLPAFLLTPSLQVKFVKQLLIDEEWYSNEN